MRNSEKIDTWRVANAGVALTPEVLLGVLGGADLCSASLRGANIQGANLQSANLQGANLRGANLWGAEFWGGFRLDGLPSGPMTAFPTPGGWHLEIGCEKRSPEDMRELIMRDDAWPEARGAQVTARRPGLIAALDLLDAHMVLHADKLAAVLDRWGTEPKEASSE